MNGSGPKPWRYRLLLRLLPRRLRKTMAQEMEETFRALLQEARSTGGASSAHRLWLREARDILKTSVRLRIHGILSVFTHRIKPVPSRTSLPTGPTPYGPRRQARTLADDLRHSIRSLVRSPAYTFFAVVTLALGLGASTAIFSALDSVLLNPIPHRDGDRMVAIWGQPKNSSIILTTSDQQRALWRNARDVFEAVEAFWSGTKTLTEGAEPREIVSASISEGLLQFLEVAPVLGRGFTPEEIDTEASVTLLGSALWENSFGKDPEVLGRRLEINGQPFTIVGVMPPRVSLPFGNPNIAVWTPLPPGSRGATTVAKLRPGVTSTMAQSWLDSLTEQMREEDPQAAGALLRTPQDSVGGSLSTYLKILIVATALLLLIACTNVSSLILSRGVLRQHETTTRASIGASRARLIREAMYENLILSLCGGIAGVGLSLLMIRVFAVLRPDDLDFFDRISLNWNMIAFVTLLALTSSVVFGLLPSIRLAYANERNLLNRAEKTGDDRPARGRMQTSLIAGQVALSFALITSASLLIQSLADLQRTDPGFDTAELVTMDIRLPLWRFPEAESRSITFSRVEEAVRGLSGVSGVTVANGIPPSGAFFNGSSMEVRGQSRTSEARLFLGGIVKADYFALLRQPILSGRAFTEEEVQDQAEVYILGESLARQLAPEGEIVGRQVRLGEGGWHTVVGVTTDVPMQGLNNLDAKAQFYVPFISRSGSGDLVIRTRGDPAQAMNEIRRAVVAIDRNIVIRNLASMDDQLSGTLATERFATWLLASFATLALILAGIGLYGTISHATRQRTREIGIRISLGAEPGRIRRMVAARTVRILGIGVGAGMILAVVGGRLLRSQLFNILPVDGRILAISVAALAMVSLAAAYLPARRAAAIDPLEAMRVD